MTDTVQRTIENTYVSEQGSSRFSSVNRFPNPYRLQEDYNLDADPRLRNLKNKLLTNEVNSGDQADSQQDLGYPHPSFTNLHYTNIIGEDGQPEFKRAPDTNQPDNIAVDITGQPLASPWSPNLKATRDANSTAPQRFPPNQLREVAEVTGRLVRIYPHFKPDNNGGKATPADTSFVIKNRSLSGEPAFVSEQFLSNARASNAVAVRQRAQS